LIPFIIKIIINHLFISNAHIIREWKLISKTAIAENLRFFTTEIDITKISHKCKYNLRSERREM
jgi:hypothetical protein